MLIFGRECSVVAVGEGANTRYQLMENGCPMATINIIGIQGDFFTENIIAVKNYSENEGLLEELTKAGVIKSVLGHIQNGFVEIPIVEIDREKMLAA